MFKMNNYDLAHWKQCQQQQQQLEAGNYKVVLHHTIQLCSCAETENEVLSHSQQTHIHNQASTWL